MINIRCSTLPDVSDCTRRAIANTQKDILEDAGYELIAPRQGVYSALGTAVYKGNNAALRSKILTGELPDTKYCQEIAQENFTESMNSESDVLFDPTTLNQNHAEKQINLLIKMYIRDIAPKIQFPENADPENNLDVYMESRIDDYLISGTIDVISAISILETKTGTSLKPYHARLGGLANLLNSTKKWKPEKLVTIYLPRVKIDKPYPGTKSEPYDVDFSMNEAWYLIQQTMRDIDNFMTSGNPACFQANPNSNLCNPKYCRAYGTGFCGYRKL